MTAKDVVVAGHHCVEYDVLDWHPDEDVMLLNDFLRLGSFEVENLHEIEEDRITSTYEGDFGFSKDYGQKKILSTVHPDGEEGDKRSRNDTSRRIYRLGYRQVVEFLKDHRSKMHEIENEIYSALVRPRPSSLYHESNRWEDGDGKENENENGSGDEDEYNDESPMETLHILQSGLCLKCPSSIARLRKAHEEVARGKRARSSILHAGSIPLSHGAYER